MRHGPPPLCPQLNYAVHACFGYAAMVCFVAMPMLGCRLTTLIFNVHFHPLDTSNACKAIDQLLLLSEAVGESHHHDHHRFPQKALRPGLDLPWRIWLAPAEKLGLIWATNATRVNAQ